MGIPCLLRLVAASRVRGATICRIDKAVHPKYFVSFEQRVSTIPYRCAPEGLGPRWARASAFGGMEPGHKLYEARIRQDMETGLLLTKHRSQIQEKTMPSLIMVRRLTTCSVISLLYAVSQGALAHTGVRDQVRSSATSTTTSNNAFVITHGCSGAEGGPDPLPVIGQSAVFPFGNASQAVWVRLGNPNTPIEPITVIGGDGLLNLSVSGVQDGSIFDTQGEEGNPGPVHALNWKDGSLNPELNGYTLFRVTVPTIVNNCVANLRLRIAVANWCEEEKNEATDPNNNRADWWFTAETGTQSFTDPDLIQPSFWTTLTVMNPNATDANCPADQRFDVAVMPSGADIDTYLPHRRFTKRPPPF
jgi:hypothetical protein